MSSYEDLIKRELFRYANVVKNEVEKLLNDIEKYNCTEKTAKRIKDDLQTIGAWVDITTNQSESLLDKGTKGVSLRGCACKAKKTTRKTTPKRK